MKKGWIFGIVILIILAIVIYYFYQKQKTETTSGVAKKISQDGEWQTISYTLPTTVDPEEFGPYYWKAIHDMASRIPCSSCRYKWESFTKFGHDVVNNRLEKPLFDEKNYNEWLDLLVKIKTESPEAKMKS